MLHTGYPSTQSHGETDSTIPMFYRMRDVLRMTALSRSTLYRRIADGSFPAPVSLGGAAKGWRRSDLEDWAQNPAGFKLMESCATVTSSQGAKVRHVRY
ncbi:AlpA family phage regulatory protein [Parapusillimonas granuli]|uniref:AlpA family phage regulatory protein n=1 Tax=Parapusillimonas granuli TaxID=380911 RepID=A0A853G8E5_9BURK|nr:putative DNA-binding transcriptional regulator AlpA [Parapusillimonas granuli]NYT51210.1 AlpA family phage regulatory protein [Parapusillimonas granuli]NYT80241.1 AlpA family phage regulatory protein [Alcaligenaceae bacterium]